MKSLLYIVILFGVWMVFSFNPDPANLILGLLVSMLTVLVFGKYFVQKGKSRFSLSRLYWFLVYIVVLAWECLKANLDVAYRVLSPKMPIKPGFVRVKTQLKSDLGRATLANSITMTPGTITVDLIGDDLYIHWIYVQGNNPEAYANRISARFEKYIKRIFE